MLEKSGQVVPLALPAALDTTKIVNGRGKTAAVAAFPTRTFTAYHIGNSLTEDLFYDFRTVATRYEATQGNTSPGDSTSGPVPA
jgi:hypothetical protein